MEIDHDLVQALRERAMEGMSPCDLARLVGKRLGVEATNSRLHAILYFKEAFRLSLADAMMVGAAPMFPGTYRTEEAVDADLRVVLERHKGAWAPRSSDSP